MIWLTNSLSRTKEQFIPLHKEYVSLYVCGITPYASSHLGHGRCYVSFDLLYRVLNFAGYTVRYCRNYTDIDDKLLKKAEELFHDQFRYIELANEYITQYQRQMVQLNCLAPTYEPRVTEHMPQIITFVQGLIDAGYAYVVGEDVFFDVRSWPSYAKLSGHNLDDLRAGCRVDVHEGKRDALDFALWKSEDVGTFWKSPWGWGRPGWHIECSALAKEYLGATIDIHAGGADLIFPHHENEIAQSESLHGKPFARYWLHNGFIRLNQEKMSKSLGNVFLLEDIFKQTDPMVLRWYFLMHQYRSPMDFALEDVVAAAKSYQRICRTFQQIKARECSVKDEKHQLLKKMIDVLMDDLNSAQCIALLFEHLRDIMQDNELAGNVKYLLQQLLGLRLDPIVEQEVEITPEIQKLIDEREQARREKNWAKADVLRDQLMALGVVMQDKKQ